MLDELLAEFLLLSDKMRNGYVDSLGKTSHTWEETFISITSDIPEVARTIYSRVAGTYRDIENQKYMDFIPGYRLIHIDELKKEYHGLMQIANVRKNGIELVIPLLADYSSCYICYVKTRHNEDAIFHYSPEDGLQKMHQTVETFFKTIIAFYSENVYFVDDNGFLDYDFEKSGIVGAKYNPDIVWWTE